MKSAKIFGIALAASALSSAPAWGGAQLRDYALQSTSPEALVLFKAEPLPSADYELAFQQEGHRNILTGGPTISVPYSATAPLVGRKLKPGTYILTMAVQQRHWATCFTDTVAFTVEAGQVYHLGTFNSAEILAELQESALERGKGQLPRGANAIGWNPKVQPQFTAPLASDLDAAQKWVARTMPRTSATVKALSTSQRQRSSGGTAKAMQVCG